MSEAPTLTVAVMAYNELEGLEPTVSELVAALRSLGLGFEVLIIDDGSTDGTSEVAARLAGWPDVRAIRHPLNLGLGGVYRTGFSEARGEWLTFFPADGQIPPQALADFAALWEGYDLLLGYIPERSVGWLPRLLSWLERALYRLLFRSFPRFQGAMMVRTRLLREIPLRTRGRGWGVLMELILRATRGPYRWTSVPTGLRSRRGGGSKVRNLRTIWANLVQLLRLRWGL